MRKLAFLVAILIAGAAPAHAKDIYVSKTTGSNKNPGTRAKPLKLMWKAMKKLEEGDTLHVAEGVYHGKRKLGVMPKIVVARITILGGYTKDFSSRDPFKHLSIISGAADRQGDSREVFQFQDTSGKGCQIVLDGFCIDRACGNYYYSEGPGGPTKYPGYVDNSSWGYQALNKKKSGSDPAIELIGRGSFTVRNMILVNNPWWGIYVKAGGGTVVIENNFILGYRGRGIEAISGGGWGKTTFQVRNNTVAFGSAVEGRALSLDPRKATGTYLVENNVLCGGYQSGIMTKFGAETLTLSNNLFYGFRGADVGDGGKPVCNAADFEDELEFENEENTHEVPRFVTKLSRDWMDLWSQRKALAETMHFTSDEMMAVRKAVGLGVYELPFFTGKTYSSYAALPKPRINFDMSRYPKATKKGEALMDWTRLVLPAIGADGERGIQPFQR